MRFALLTCCNDMIGAELGRRVRGCDRRPNVPLRPAMNDRFNRRHFLKNASLLPLCPASGLSLTGTPTQAAEPIKRSGGPMLKVSLNAYSFARLLNDHLRGRGKGLTLFDLLDFCAQNNFEAIDPTGYYFPGYGSVREGNKGKPTDAYLYEFKRRAF